MIPVPQAAKATVTTAEYAEVKAVIQNLCFILANAVAVSNMFIRTV